METARPDRLGVVLALVRRLRWWALGASAVLYVLLPDPESWVTAPAFALFWLSVLADSVRAFSAGRRAG